MLGAIALVSLAIAGSVSSSPVPDAPKPVAIPFRKRTLPLASNGIVNPAALADQMARVQAKYGRRDTALRARTNFNPISSHTVVNKRWSEPLKDEDDDELWDGWIGIGTPAKQFIVDFDTGSSDLWVPSASCTSCGAHNKYDNTTSSTSKPQPGSFSILYGDGSTTSGPIYSDTVTIAGIPVTNQNFSAVTQESSSFVSAPMDGILGLGFPSISETHSTNFVQNAKDQGKITQAIFCFALNKDSSELYIGGANSDKYTGDFTCTPVTQQGYWMVEGSAKPSVANLAAEGYTGRMIIDSGTTILVGDDANVLKFYMGVPGAMACPVTECGGEGYYTVPCNNIPGVVVTFSGHDLVIPPAFFNLGQVSSGSDRCVTGLASSPAADEIGWIMGDTLMKSTYTKFDMEKSQVCFATPKSS